MQLWSDSHLWSWHQDYLKDHTVFCSLTKNHVWFIYATDFWRHMKHFFPDSYILISYISSSHCLSLILVTLAEASGVLVIGNPSIALEKLFHLYFVNIRDLSCKCANLHMQFYIHVCLFPTTELVNVMLWHLKISSRCWSILEYNTKKCFFGNGPCLYTAVATCSV